MAYGNSELPFRTRSKKGQRVLTLFRRRSRESSRIAVVLYEIFSGKQPFTRENIMAMAEAVKNVEPAPRTGLTASRT